VPLGFYGLAQARAAPLLPGRGRAARDRRRDRGAPAEAVIDEAGLLSRLGSVSDAGETVLGVPDIIALPVGGEIAVGVVEEGPAGEALPGIDRMRTSRGDRGGRAGAGRTTGTRWWPRCSRPSS
jgi:hypothetical protein